MLSRENRENLHSAIFETGALGDPHFWWEEVVRLDETHEGGSVPACRIYRMKAMQRTSDEMHKTFMELDICEEVVAEAVRQIAQGFYSVESSRIGSLRPVAPSTVAHCERLLREPESGCWGFDRSSSDEVLQVIAYGGVAWR